MAATGAAAAAGAAGAGAGILIVGAAVGLGGKLIRTVSFFGCTLAASVGFGGTAPEGGFGMLSAITFWVQTRVDANRCQILIRDATKTDRGKPVRLQIGLKNVVSNARGDRRRRVRPDSHHHHRLRRRPPPSLLRRLHRPRRRTGSGRAIRAPRTLLARRHTRRAPPASRLRPRSEPPSRRAER